MFVFEIFHEEDQILPGKRHLEAVTRKLFYEKDVYVYEKSQEINCAGVFFK